MAKNLSADAGDVGSVPGLRRFPGEGNGNLFQYSFLENFIDRGAWWATVHGVAKSLTQLSAHTHTHTHTHQLYIERIYNKVLLYSTGSSIQYRMINLNGKEL